MRRLFGFVVLVFVMALTSISLLCHYDFIQIIEDSVECYEVVDFDNDFHVVKVDASDINKVINNFMLEVYSKKTIEDRVVIEGYSSKLSKSMMVDGRKINIQISQFDDTCIIGYPLIKNSF